MKIDAIFCDMDGTLVDYPNKPFHSSWDALAEAVPDKEEWFRLRDLYYPRKHLSVLGIVGLPIAFNPKKQEVREKAKWVISDFRELNKILALE